MDLDVGWQLRLLVSEPHCPGVCIPFHRPWHKIRKQARLEVHEFSACLGQVHKCIVNACQITGKVSWLLVGMEVPRQG